MNLVISPVRDADLVSVVVPTYNRARQLPAAIDSVLEQDYRSLEVIVVDDGSTDATAEVLARYADRVTVVRQSNAGPSAARNAGIRASRGDVLMFLDSDDVWLPGKVRIQVAALAAAGPETPCCLGNMTLAYADGSRNSSFSLSLIEPSIARGLWTNPLAVLATRFVLFNQCVAIRRSALDRIGGFDERHHAMEDYDLSLRLATLGPWAFVRQVVAVWNQGSAGSLTTQTRNDPLRLARTISAIHRALAEGLRDRGAGSVRESRLGFERSRCRLRERAAEWSAARSMATRLAGRLLGKTERLFDVLYTHSPFYPAMRVRPFDADLSDDGAVNRAAVVIDQRT